jgi:hypothetical protein
MIWDEQTDVKQSGTESESMLRWIEIHESYRGWEIDKIKKRQENPNREELGCVWFSHSPTVVAQRLIYGGAARSNTTLPIL